MMPPATASGQPIALADAFDVPVFVRSGSPLAPKKRPLQNRIDRASLMWPGTHQVPRPGSYLVSTTWRDVVDAAMTVGRDPVPWLASVPGLASAEIIARRAPLAAYLHRVASQTVPRGRSGYQIEPNVVYEKGTEKTARAMFSYRIGMTMAEWACRGLMGCRSTIHAEATTPVGHGPMWSSQKSQPDLVGDHWQFPQIWLVEAKGGRRLGKTKLREGADQLTVPGLMKGPHMRVLCGASIEHRVFMTIDIEAVDVEAVDLGPDDANEAGPSGPPDPEVDDDELLVIASSRMLTYYALQGLPRAALAVRPVGEGITSRRRNWDGAADLVTPLEGDEVTLEVRTLAQDPEAYARIPASSRFDMLTGRVPGTDLVIGMSRRLFAACRQLDQERTALANTEGARPEDAVPDLLDEDAYEERGQAQRSRFAELEEGSRERIRATVREEYEVGRRANWRELLDIQPPVIAETAPGLLEGVTPDTYVAIDTRRSAQGI